MRKWIILSLLSIITLISYTQIQRPENYKSFDKRLIHFGVQLGVNKTSFNLTPVYDAYGLYKVRSIESRSQPGAQVGMVASLKLGSPVFRLRFVPTFSFQERVINMYSDPINDEIKESYNEERVNSSNVDLPLMFQLRTLRYTNFAAYCLGGVQYSIDLQSVEDKNQNYVDPFIKIKKRDWMFQFGGGIEFFAEFFKFGIELKYSQGFKNVLIQDNTPVSTPIQSLLNNSWILSITFEG
jgi:hypothetical protein